MNIIKDKVSYIVFLRYLNNIIFNGFHLKYRYQYQIILYYGF